MIKARGMLDSEFSFVLSACAPSSQRALARPFVAARRAGRIEADCSFASFYRNDAECAQFFDDHVIKVLFAGKVS